MVKVQVSCEKRNISFFFETDMEKDVFWELLAKEEYPNSDSRKINVMLAGNCLTVSRKVTPSERRSG